ncbi:unnamed protein product [Danaus chrysippus]|uniref:(African queen) hypothetical protein n=1 Tax=Danaus chrysippus TaxID=151541 RepID=A0A8J2VUF9_9NEOP|nr:unnamed protein product [Danaus chrysippus]
MQFSVLTWCKEAMDSETTGSEGSSGVRIVTRKSLFDKMKNENLRNLEEKLCFLRDHLLTQDNLSEKDGVIVHAAQVELRKSGKRDASRVLQDITSSPTRATKYKKAFDTSKCGKSSRLTPMEALKMFIDADLTRAQYEVIRNTNKKFFPCYSLIQEAKKKCYPPPETITITSTCAETQLQPLIDITVKRLSEFLEEVLLTIKEQERNTLKLICKWGCDGSQQAQYKQKLQNEADSDANIFQSCFVPVRLICGKDNQKVLWENPTPSSARFCRPIRFRFVKETTDVTNAEINYVKNSINNLVATEVDIDGEKFLVHSQFVMTMVDGKELTMLAVLKFLPPLISFVFENYASNENRNAL